MVQIDFGRKLDNKYRFDPRHPVTGYFHATKKGMGFVQPDNDPGGDDMYIAQRDTLGAMDGDKVSVKVVQDGFNIRNVVTEVLEHHYTQAVGVVTSEKNKTFVIPNNTKLPAIRISRKQQGDAKPDDMVVVRFLTYGDGVTPPTGSITEILGNKDAKGVDMTAIVRALEIPTGFSPDEEAQAQTLANVPDTCAGREDLRDLFLVTIDETGTKDIDDAVSLTRRDNGWELGVHIADASYFIQEGTPLDKEALERGTSVYMPDRIIPMLPEILSTGACSLQAGKDRLAMSVLMDFSEEGNLEDYRITPSLIRVSCNTDYKNAQAILDNTDGTDSLAATLKDMLTLGKKLEGQRRQRGEVEFTLPDVRIVLDDNGHPLAIQVEEENDVSRMISDFMIAANETVAKAFADKGLPCIFRVHEGPDAEAMAALEKLAQNLGLLENAGGTPLQLQALLDAARGTEYENLITLAVLHSMKHAHYEEECRGHYGLAADYYCHFTSPIRRYPDLVVHRLIHEYQGGTLTDARQQQYKDSLAAVCEHCSAMEHRANVCEREADKEKILQYLAMHVGEEADGMISGVNKWGFFVQLPDTSEGHIDIRALTDDDYELDEENFCLKGTKTGQTFQLGDKVHIRIASVDLRQKNAEFALCKENV